MIKNGKYIICKVCGKSIYQRKSRIAHRKYCSRDCAGKDRQPLTDIHKSKISKANKGKLRTKAQRQRIRASIGDRHGKNNPRWAGGRINIGGYISIYYPSHPCASKIGYVPEHRLTMEKHINRYLSKIERVHHINFNTIDNRIDNLMLFKNDSEHKKYHIKINRLARHQAQPLLP